MKWLLVLRLQYALWSDG